MNTNSMRWISLLLLFVGGVVSAQPTPPASTQPYPSKPVRIVVGFAAGGSVDLVARTLAQQLTAAYGRQVVVENRPGAASHIAGNFVAKSAPDGYTLLVGAQGGLSTNLAIYTKMPYNPLEELTPITLLVYQANVLIVNLTVPSRTLKEFIALGKARPGQLSYGTGGTGGGIYIPTVIFNSMTGIKMVHVPYKGGAPALIDLVGGQIDLVFQPVPEAIPYLKSGRVRALGVTSPKRSALLPQVPTIAEAGVPGYAYVGWHGAAGPAGMSKDLAARISGDINKALAAPDVQSRFAELGLDIAGGTPEQFAALMREDLAMMVKLVKEVGIPPVD